MKAEKTEIQQAVAQMMSEQTQKGFDLRQEVFKKITDIQGLVSGSISKKVGYEEFTESLSQKVDSSTFRTTLDQKVNFSDLDNLRKHLDTLTKDLESKATFREVEQHAHFTKTLFEDFNKEIMLKANIKDLIPLLDTKANVEDVNNTLQLVQKEVEKCVVEDEMRKALND